MDEHLSGTYSEREIMEFFTKAYMYDINRISKQGFFKFLVKIFTVSFKHP